MARQVAQPLGMIPSLSARELPSGTVTFLFTDVEGSTRLLQEHGPAYAEYMKKVPQILPLPR